MNITILKNALEKYLCATESDDEKLLCAKALEELTCVMDRYENADCWDNDAVVLAADASSGIEGYGSDYDNQMLEALQKLLDDPDIQKMLDNDAE